MAEQAAPNPHVDIYAYLAALEARIEALEAVRAAQEERAAALLKRLEATLEALGDMPQVYEGETPGYYGERLRTWIRGVRVVAAG